MNFRKQKTANFAGKYEDISKKRGTQEIASDPFSAAKASGKKKIKAGDVEKLAKDKGYAGGRGFGTGVKKAAGQVTAIAGQPERFITNKLLSDEAAKSVRNVGRLGYKKGGNKFVNAAVGRTITGKLARIGGLGAAAGLTASALSNRNRETY